MRGKQDTVAAACGEAARECAAGLWCRLEVQPFATRVYSIEINLVHRGAPRSRPAVRARRVRHLSLLTSAVSFFFLLILALVYKIYTLPAAASDVQRVSRGPCPVPAAVAPAQALPVPPPPPWVTAPPLRAHPGTHYMPGTRGPGSRLSKFSAFAPSVY